MNRFTEEETGELQPEEEGFHDDIMSFLGLGKGALGAQADQDENDHDKVLSYLGLKSEKSSSMLAALGIQDQSLLIGTSGEESLSSAPNKPAEVPFQSGFEAWNSSELKNMHSAQTFVQANEAESKSLLNVSASPFRPSKPGAKTGAEDMSRLNPTAVPFVPTKSTSPHSGVQGTTEASSAKMPDGNDIELSRAQAAIRHYQMLYTNCKEDLQASNKACQKERELAHKAQETCEQKTKEADRLRMELLGEVHRSKLTADQLAASQAEMAYYKKLMEQIQSQIQLTWAQFIGKLQQEAAARQAAEETVGQLQAALQLVRGELEQSNLRNTELHSSLKGAQLMALQHQERAEAKDKEAAFHRTMYTTAARQVEASHAAMRASLELERQARQEAEVRTEQQAPEPPGGRSPPPPIVSAPAPNSLASEAIACT